MAFTHDVDRSHEHIRSKVGDLVDELARRLDEALAEVKRLERENGELLDENFELKKGGQAA